jgi:hypothetical protein
MRKFVTAIILATLLFTLGSCALAPISYPTDEAISAAKFPAPSVEQAQSLIMSNIYETYKDPDSVLIRNLQVGEFGAINLASGYPTFGYKVDFYLNAKNGRGAYGGYHFYSHLVTATSAIEMVGVRLSTVTYEFVPDVNYYFTSESDLRRNAPH